jgi:hypothetical protein
MNDTVRSLIPQNVSPSSNIKNDNMLQHNQPSIYQHPIIASGQQGDDTLSLTDEWMDKLSFFCTTIAVSSTTATIWLKNYDESIVNSKQHNHPRVFCSFA